MNSQEWLGDYSRRHLVLVGADLRAASRASVLQALQALLSRFPNIETPPKLALAGPGALELSPMLGNEFLLSETFPGETDTCLLYLQLGLLPEPIDHAFKMGAKAAGIPCLELDLSYVRNAPAQAAAWWLRYHLVPGLWREQRGGICRPMGGVGRSGG